MKNFCIRKMGKDSDWKKETICLEAITLGIHNKQE